jgi:gliding motility-associated-like protein
MGRTGDNPILSGIPIAGSRVEASDTLASGGYHYVHINENVKDSSFCYYVDAFIDKLTSSQPSNNDSTIHLAAEFDSCSASMKLIWNDYNTWRGNIARYEIYTSTDGTSYQLYNTLLEGTNEITMNDIEADRLYRIYVLAFRQNTNDSSSSNRVDIDTRMAINPAYIHSDYGTVTNEHPLVKFSVDPVSELSNYILLRSVSPAGPFDSVTNLLTIDKSVEYIDPVSALDRPYYYKLKAINNCRQDVRISENTASTIFLQAAAEGTTGILNWTAYQNWLRGVASYRIQRKFQGMEFEEIASVHDLIFEDNSMNNLVNNNIGSEVCYRIVAIEGAGNPYLLQSSSTSNEICVNFPVNIHFDFNAFVPGSAENNTFGPTLDFIPKTFSFKIFNRWGTKVFESTEPLNPRWNGYYLGSAVPEGVYRYQLEYQNENGNQVVMHGNVTVVYP